MVEGGGDGLAFLGSSQGVCVHFKEHGHGPHDAGDFFMFNQEGLLVGADVDDDAAQGVAGGGGGFRRG